MATLDPIPAQARHHVETVHELLRSAILRGEIPAGQITTQAALSEQLDVGRTPLREALRMLQSEGLIVSERNRQVQIADLSGDDAEQLYVMRIALETAAIRITVPTLTSDSFAQLEGAMAQMDHYMRVGDQPGMRTPHRLFHRILIEGAGSGSVAGSLSSLITPSAIACSTARPRRGRSAGRSTGTSLTLRRRVIPISLLKPSPPTTSTRRS